jgi:hypothetical protein
VLHLTSFKDKNSGLLIGYVYVSTFNISSSNFSGEATANSNSFGIIGTIYTSLYIDLFNITTKALTISADNESGFIGTINDSITVITP